MYTIGSFQDFQHFTDIFRTGYFDEVADISDFSFVFNFDVVPSGEFAHDGFDVFAVEAKIAFGPGGGLADIGLGDI